MSFINKLEGCRINKVLAVHDYYQLYFDTDAVLTIYNPFIISQRVSSSASVNIDILSGSIVKFIEVVEHDCITFTFDGDLQLSIKIDYESFVGPEALELNIPNEQIMVWN